MRQEMRVQLTESGADAERLDMLTTYLRAELLALDVDDVTAVPAGEPPPGARAADVIAVGALLVAFRQSAESLHAMLTAIRRWLGRSGATARTIRIELGDDSLELTAASDEDQQRLIDVFISRHTGGDS